MWMHTCMCVCVRMTQFGRTCFALTFVYLIGRTKKRAADEHTNGHILQTYERALISLKNV